MKGEFGVCSIEAAGNDGLIEDYLFSWNSLINAFSIKNINEQSNLPVTTFTTKSRKRTRNKLSKKCFICISYYESLDFNTCLNCPKIVLA